MSDYAQKVREYLAYCRRSAAWLEARGSALDPRHHPTEAGACKLIPHGGMPAEAKRIREAFRDLAGEAA